MKVFTSLLVFAFVFASVSSTAEDRLKDGISRVDRAIAEIKKQIASVGVDVEFSTHGNEKKILSGLVAILKKLLERVTEAKGKLEAKLPKNLSTLTAASVELRLADGIAQIKKAFGELQKTAVATAAQLKASANAKDKKYIEKVEEILKKHALKLKEAMQKLEAKLKA